jgi:UDP-3-O-[3-hydroxymyristoyl] glucosamine N-acyltransferase
MAVLVCDNPHLAYATIADSLVDVRPQWSGLSDSARIDPSAKLASDIVVAPGAVVAANVEIGSRSVIGANAVISAGTTIGEECFIGNNVSISHSLIGDRVIIHAGVCIGQDGFGYASVEAEYKKVPQLGRVIIQDDVEIGAITTVDRGAADDTVIGAGTKIDNQVHIGHNCRIGRHCILVGQAGLAGSVTVGDYCVLGAKVGVTDHVTIGSGAQIAAKSGITKDIPPNAVFAGFPGKPIGDWRREMATVARLGRESRSQAKNKGKPVAKE